MNTHERVIELMEIAEDQGTGWTQRNCYEAAIRALVAEYASASEECGTLPENIAEQIHDMTQVGG